MLQWYLKETFVHTFLAALFTIAKSGNKQMPIDREADKPHVVYTCNGILLLKEENSNVLQHR